MEFQLDYSPTRHLVIRFINLKDSKLLRETFGEKLENLPPSWERNLKGYYFAATKNRPATIEIYRDNILEAERRHWLESEWVNFVDNPREIWETVIQNIWIKTANVICHEICHCLKQALPQTAIFEGELPLR